MTKMSCNHVLKALFSKIRDKKMSVTAVENKAGVGANVIGRWRAQSEPLLGNVIAALNAVGLDLTVTTIEKAGDQLELFNNNVKETKDGTTQRTKEDLRV
jgi:hypothetical protein